MYNSAREMKRFHKSRKNKNIRRAEKARVNPSDKVFHFSLYTLFQLRFSIFDNGMKTSFKLRGGKVLFSDVVISGFTKFPYSSARTCVPSVIEN